MQFIVNYIMRPLKKSFILPVVQSFYAFLISIISKKGENEKRFFLKKNSIGLEQFEISSQCKTLKKQIGLGQNMSKTAFLPRVPNFCTVSVPWLGLYHRLSRTTNINRMRTP